jgi:tetratricopeptide (TPR) repeat protein
VGVREVRDVRSAPAAQQGAPDRLLSTSTSLRSDYWDVALGMVGREPLLGEGAGSFERVWVRERPALLYVRDAHNGYLEALAELGPVGLALLVVALGTPLLATRRAVAGPTGCAALAAYAALLAHVVLDWDLELPAVTLCIVLLGVVLIRETWSGRAVPLRGVVTAALLACAALLAGAATVVHAGNGALADAHAALDRGDAEAAREAAERARRFAPWSAEPRRLMGEAELAAGRLPLARRHLRRASAEDPGSWENWLALAFATTADERAEALGRLRALDPLAPELDALSDPSEG